MDDFEGLSPEKFFARAVLASVMLDVPNPEAWGSADYLITNDGEDYNSPEH